MAVPPLSYKERMLETLRFIREKREKQTNASSLAHKIEGMRQALTSFQQEISLALLQKSSLMKEKAQEISAIVDEVEVASHSQDMLFFLEAQTNSLQKIQQSLDNQLKLDQNVLRSKQDEIGRMQNLLSQLKKTLRQVKAHLPFQRGVFLATTAFASHCSNRR